MPMFAGAPKPPYRYGSRDLLHRWRYDLDVGGFRRNPPRWFDTVHPGQSDTLEHHVWRRLPHQPKRCSRIHRFSHHLDFRVPGQLTSSTRMGLMLMSTPPTRVHTGSRSLCDKHTQAQAQPSLMNIHQVSKAAIGETLNWGFEKSDSLESS